MPNNSLGHEQPNNGPRGRTQAGPAFTILRQGLEGRWNNVIGKDVQYLDSCNAHDPYSSQTEPIVEKD